MIRRVSLVKAAIPVIMAGIAFFLAACQPKTTPPVMVEKGKPDPLVLAESYVERGELEKALEAYGRFLQDAPKTEKSALVLKRTSEIYLELNQPAEALTVMEEICQEYPDLDWIPGMRYDMATILSRIGEHRRSATEALSWLDTYPQHPLKRDVYFLLGEDFSALGDKAEAFHWWLMAKKEWAGDSEEAARIDERLNELIAGSGPMLLRQFAVDAAGTPYAPQIYDRMAQLHLEQGESGSAERAAISLLHSTNDDIWISRGNAFLARLKEEKAVKQGVLGVLLPLSGPFSIYGKEVLKGIQLGMGLSNDSSGNPGLTLLIRDTEGSPEAAAAALEDLANIQKVMAVIGPVSSTAAGAAAKKSQEAGVPIITLSQREGIVEQGDMVFRNLLTPAQEIEGLLDAALNRMGLKRFGILYPDNAYGRYCMETFWGGLEQKGGIVTAAESYGVDQTDFADQIKKMVGLYYPRPESLVKKLEDMRTPEDKKGVPAPEEPEPIIDFDAIFIPDSSQRVAMIAPQLAFYDVLGVQLLGTSAWQSQQLIEMAGKYVQGAVFCSGFAPNAVDPEVRAFVDAYRENFDGDPDILAANGYDTIRVLKKILAEESIRTRRDLAAALLGSPGIKGVSGTITFDTRGEAERTPILLKISGNTASLLN
ncbi:MAG: penicillin-binding protein activator [Deltaproteobacteria bacterium]|nr:penicillin-binding protein activator [Deltaproteobacteria bacterium]